MAGNPRFNFLFPAIVGRLARASILAVFACAFVCTSQGRSAQLQEFLQKGSETIEGWWWHESFGWMNLRAEPWIWHTEHEWLYLTGPSAQGTYAFNEVTGWQWLSLEDYPWIKSHDFGWLYFFGKSAENRRAFFSASLNTYLVTDDTRVVLFPQNPIPPLDESQWRASDVNVEADVLNRTLVREDWRDASRVLEGEDFLRLTDSLESIREVVEQIQTRLSVIDDLSDYLGISEEDYLSVEELYTAFEEVGFAAHESLRQIHRAFEIFRKESVAFESMFAAMEQVNTALETLGKRLEHQWDQTAGRGRYQLMFETNSIREEVARIASSAENQALDNLAGLAISSETIALVGEARALLEDARDFLSSNTGSVERWTSLRTGLRELFPESDNPNNFVREIARQLNTRRTLVNLLSVEYWQMRSRVGNGSDGSIIIVGPPDLDWSWWNSDIFRVGLWAPAAGLDPAFESRLHSIFVACDDLLDACEALTELPSGILTRMDQLSLLENIALLSDLETKIRDLNELIELPLERES